MLGFGTKILILEIRQQFSFLLIIFFLDTKELVLFCFAVWSRGMRHCFDIYS